MFLAMNHFEDLMEAMDDLCPEKYSYIHKLGYNSREFLYALQPTDPKVATPSLK